MKFKLLLTIGFVVFVLSTTLGCEESPQPSLKIHTGEIITELSVQDLTGSKTKISLITGKITILNVWATWCGPCRHEMPSLDRLSSMLNDRHYMVVGLSVDTDDHVVREFLIERKVRFTSYMDPAMEVANQVFGIRVFPSTFVFGPDGQFLEVIEGWREWDTPDMVEKFAQLRKLAQESGKKRS